MQNTVLTFSIIASIFAIALKPKYAIVVYLTIVIWFPEYLRISIGTIDISCSRIVGTVLLTRCLFNNLIRSKFRWSHLDKAVFLNILVSVGVMLITQPTWVSVENRSGFIMDTLFAYVIARFIITDKEKLISVIKCISIVLIPLAVLGCIEAITGWQPFVPLKNLVPWLQSTGEVENNMRWGFTRAVGPFNHSILFGGAFAIFLPVIYTLRYEKNIWKTLVYVLSAVAIAGALSSMSSGPWVMIIVVLFCLFMENHRSWIKPMLTFFIISIVFIQIFSNRPFYNVIFSYVSLIGGAGYHRIRLIDLAIRDFGKWWLVGYGGKDPGWGLGVSWSDITNEYIMAGVKYGLAGIIALCLVLYVSFSSLKTAYLKDKDPYMKSIYWALGSFLIAVSIVWMSASFFGQLTTIFYCYLGIIGSVVLIPDRLKQKHKKQTIDKIYETKLLQNTVGV
jgi:hypothetical protein